MRKTLALLLIIATGFSPVLTLAQQPAPAQDVTPTIRVSTRVVLVDVVATNNSGAAVSDLKPEDFTVEESGHKQKIAFFTPPEPEQTQQPAPLPPNVYSNRPEYTTPAGPLTVILIDALNTPVRNQQYAREQLLRYAATQHHRDARRSGDGARGHRRRRPAHLGAAAG